VHSPHSDQRQLQLAVLSWEDPFAIAGLCVQGRKTLCYSVEHKLQLLFHLRISGGKFYFSFHGTDTTSNFYVHHPVVWAVPNQDKG